MCSSPFGVFFLMFHWCQLMCPKRLFGLIFFYKISFVETSTTKTFCRCEWFAGFLRAFKTTRRFLEKIWKLKHGHGAVALGSWIARSRGKPDNMPDMFQKLKRLKRSVVRQDRPVNCNLPLLQPEFVSKIDFAEGEERRNCYGIKMAEDWGIFGHFGGNRCETEDPTRCRSQPESHSLVVVQGGVSIFF